MLTHMKTKYSIYVAVEPKLYGQLFSPRAQSLLRSCGDVTLASAAVADSAALAQVIQSYDILVTGWGTPAITPQALEGAPRLKLIAHSAGTIRHLVPESIFESRVKITHSAAAMGPSVAEACLAMILASLKRIHVLDRQLKSGMAWDQARTPAKGRQIRGMSVGVIGAGHTGRAFIRLLRGFGARLFIFDPYLTADRARQMDVTPVPLEELMSCCDVVAIHAPATPETHHMIGKNELALMRDGSLLVNTARSWLVDQDALVAELSTGRICAALDVYDHEPLPVESPLRRMENVLITPHIGSYTHEAYFGQGRIVVNEIHRFSAGVPLKYAIKRAQMATMA